MSWTQINKDGQIMYERNDGVRLHQYQIDDFENQETKEYKDHIRKIEQHAIIMHDDDFEEDENLEPVHPLVAIFLLGIIIVMFVYLAVGN